MIAPTLPAAGRQPARLRWAGVVRASLIGAGALLAALGLAAADPAPAPITFDLTTPTPRYNSIQVEHVLGWLHVCVPECAPEFRAKVAERFLDELRDQRPGVFSDLLTISRPDAQLQAMLVSDAAATLRAKKFAALRETLAIRRIELLLQVEEQAGGHATAVKIVDRIKGTSEVYSRRLVEGSIDNDLLLILIKRSLEPAKDTPAPTPAKAREVTAQDIVAEYRRQNQVGNAAQHLQGYIATGVLTSSARVKQPIVLFKLRPNLFRLLLLDGNRTRYIFAFDGTRYWEQRPGAKPVIKSESTIRYLGEFLDPLWANEGFSFNLEANATIAGQECFCLRVQRSDGSTYRAYIDTATYREIGQANSDGSIVRFGDFRDVGGVTLPFSQVVTNSAGQTSELTFERISPNPGLLPTVFSPAASAGPDYFDLERIWPTVLPAANPAIP